jgi:hypothetical protein
MKNIHILSTGKPSIVASLPCGSLEYSKTGKPFKETLDWKLKNIYITSDEEIKDGEYGICLNLVRKGFKSHQAVFKMDSEQRQAMEELGGQKKAEVLKVILTTDQDLIAEGVQAVEEDFLNWFVKNPSCERVETYSLGIENSDTGESGHYKYEIIIPKGEPKQECSWSDIEEGCVNDECECERKEILSQAKHRALKQETLEEYINTVVREFKDELAIDFTVGGIKLGAKWQAERMYSELSVRLLCHNILMKIDPNYNYNELEKILDKQLKKK